MNYILILFLGILMGILYKKFGEAIKEIFRSNPDNDYKVVFNVSLLVHGTSNNGLNKVVSTPDIEIIVKGDSEDEVTNFVQDLVEEEIRVKIQSVELIENK